MHHLPVVWYGFQLGRQLRCWWTKWIERASLSSLAEIPLFYPSSLVSIYLINRTARVEILRHRSPDLIRTEELVPVTRRLPTAAATYLSTVFLCCTGILPRCFQKLLVSSKSSPSFGVWTSTAFTDSTHLYPELNKVCGRFGNHLLVFASTKFSHSLPHPSLEYTSEPRLYSFVFSQARSPIMTRPKVPEDKRQRIAQACDTCKRRKQKVR